MMRLVSSFGFEFLSRFMCGTIQIVGIRVGDVCREWRFHLTLVFASAQGSSFRVRILLSILRVCLHQPLFNDETDDESDTVWESFSSILCDDD